MSDRECDWCDGTGKCNECEGGGTQDHYCDCEYCGESEDDCEECEGTGECIQCEGTGKVKE